MHKGRKLSLNGKTSMYILCLLLAAATTVMSGCASVDSGKVYENDGKRYGVTSGTFRNRWWNYFERAVSYSEGGYYSDAANDLATALGMRDTDGRRARTYGMHFVDYFPHREMGIAYLGLGRPEDAIRELELSVSQEDTAKAKFYLNKAREAVLLKSHAEHAGPSVALDGQLPAVTGALEITVSGTAKDDGYVSAVSVNGVAEMVELASKEVGFRRTVPLAEGLNSITVTATGLTGKTTTLTGTVVADRRGPAIELDSPSTDIVAAGTAVTVSGVAYDTSGVAGITVNGNPVPIAPGVEAPFSTTITPGKPVIEITARDAAGNTTTATAGQSLSAALPSPGPKGTVSLGLYASADGRISGQAKDCGPGPRIRFRELTGELEVYYDSIYVDGQVSASTDVVSLKMNGEELLPRKGKNIFFNFTAPLKDGENTFDFVASDASGDVTKKTVSVIRASQAARSIPARLSISAIPFKANEGSFFSEPAYDSFLGSMTSQGRFKMVERALLEDVLAEQALSQEDIVDPSTAARLGKVVSAECVLAGKFYETERSVEVYARLVDTETAEVLGSHDVYGEDKSLTGVANLMEGLATKFRNSFPMVEGIIIKADGDSIVVDIGKNKGVGRNAMLVVFSEGEPLVHPVTGKVLGSPTKVLGKAKVTEVYDDMAMAEVVSTEKGAEIAPLEQVITK